MIASQTPHLTLSFTLGYIKKKRKKEEEEGKFFLLFFFLWIAIKT
jgi:hypothetical protein